MDAVKEQRMEYPSYKKALQAVTDTAVVVPPPLTAGYQRFDKQTLIDSIVPGFRECQGRA